MSPARGTGESALDSEPCTNAYPLSFPRDACKWIVGILRLAFDYDCEAELAGQLIQDMEKGQLPALKLIQSRYLPRRHSVTDIKTAQHQLEGYDRLLDSTAVEVRHV